MEQVEINNAQVDNEQGISVGELMSEGTSEPTVESYPVATGTDYAPADGAKSEEPIANQTDFNKVLGKRLHAERTKYESSDAYKLGMELLNERAKKDNVSVEEAARRIKDDKVNAKAAQYAKNPQDFYKDYLTRDNSPKETRQSDEVSPETLAKMLIDAGAAEFGVQNITPEMAQDTLEHGAEYALLKWLRANGTQPKQANLPRTIRPVGQGANVPTNDYEHMSDSDFRKLEAKLKQATLDGRRVKL